MKNFYKILLVLIMTFTTIQSFAYHFESNGIYYNILSEEDKACEVTYKNVSYNSYTGSINIPSSVTYNGTTYSVTEIGYMAFYECTGLTNVTMGNSVTTIDHYAFYKCTGLTNVTIPNSVTTIGEGAFSGCSGLTGINIHNAITSIGDNAFAGCTGLTTVNFNATNCTIVGEYNWPFSGCYNINNVSSTKITV
mgnify:CR=1 FL=1